MRLRDAVATGLVDVVVCTYVGYLALGRLPILESVRGVAALGLVLGLASEGIAGRARFRRRWAPLLGGLATLALGIAALTTQHDSMLALFMASIIGFWVAGAYVRTSTAS
jgi:hypothetical protein